MVEISVNGNTMEMLTKEKRMESTLYWTPSINLSPQKTLLYILSHIKPQPSDTLFKFPP